MMATGPRNVRYGWARNAKGKKVKVKAEQKVIKRILKEAALGHGPTMIADELNEDNVPTPRGGRWHPATVSNILDKNAEDIPAPEAPAESPLSDLLEGDGSISWEESYWDQKKGKQRFRTRTLTIEDREQLGVQAEAYRQLSLAEKAERVMFTEPLPLKFGKAAAFGGGDGVDQLVKEMTRQTGLDVHALVDQIEDQPEVKRDIRNAVTALLSEVAIRRQDNLHLRQERERARKRDSTRAPGEAPQSRPSAERKTPEKLEFRQTAKPSDLHTPKKT